MAGAFVTGEVPVLPVANVGNYALVTDQLDRSNANTVNFIDRFQQAADNLSV